MKYNTYICCAGFCFDFNGCKAWVFFCANAKIKDIACIVKHMPQWFYSVNKRCSIIF